MAKQFSTCFGNSPCTLISLTSTRSPSTPKNLAIDFWDPCEVDQIGSPLNDPKDGNSPTISSFGGWSKWVDLPTHLLDFPVLFCFSEISEVRVLDGPTQEIGDLGIMHGRARWWIIVKTAVKGKAFCSKIQMICTWYAHGGGLDVSTLNPPSGVLESLPCENPFIGVISDKFLHELRKLGVGMRNEPLNACALAMQTMDTGF